MAKKLENFNWGLSKGGRKYSWREWTDGSVWEVQKGIDFECTQASFVVGLHNKAKMVGLHVRTRTTGDRVIFQFYGPARKTLRRT